MIFLTLGTSSFPFSRLAESVDQALLHLNTREELVAQLGNTRYTFRYKTSAHRLFSYEKTELLFKTARVVISHAGAGSVIMAGLYAKNRPFVVPRMRAHREHVDDHQTYFTRFCLERRLVFSTTGVVRGLEKYINSPERASRLTMTDNPLIRSLEKFINP